MGHFTGSGVDKMHFKKFWTWVRIKSLRSHSVKSPDAHTPRK